MCALFMDFPGDPNVAAIGDQYLSGPALVVASVTDQGATSRTVCLPSGADWYNYWTNERYKGGQTITASAPIDTVPLFVRAGSIIPLGKPILTTEQKQYLEKIKVYPGADGDFTLYNDDGKTYAYEKGDFHITDLHWDNAASKFTQKGSVARTIPDSQLVEVVGR